MSTTPRVGNFGWCRQRMRPLAWSLLWPLAWSPLFLMLTAIPLALPGRTPNDQIISLTFFSIAWGLVILPILFSRNSQPMSDGSLLALPVDWISLTLASVVFPLHLSIDPRIGWISYALYWVAYIRTIQLVQVAMMTPPARFLLPIEPEDWDGGLDSPWEIDSSTWSRKRLASVKYPNGRLTLSGSARSGQNFLSLAFVHKSGFVQDPFHECSSKEPGLSELLAHSLQVVGRAWPQSLLHISEEE
ncbi:MAG: hypothetical protein L7R66_03395 [Candidatus Thalassarchaeaceae archaeon]|nr:hypothetical protein [Candidatus Thalassarchaeaceae archaeon]